jgi:hypothetical protein
MVEKGHQNDATVDDVVAHVTEVAGRMRWVMGMKEARAAE